MLLWPVQIRRIQRGLSGLDIGFGGIDPFRTLEDLPEEIQSKVDRDADIGGNEVVGGPRTECVEAVEEDDD